MKDLFIKELIDNNCIKFVNYDYDALAQISNIILI